MKQLYPAGMLNEAGYTLKVEALAGVVIKNLSTDVLLSGRDT
jgi:hypothetical protein